FRRERGQFLDRMAQPVGLASGALDLRAMLRDRGLSLAPRAPQSRDLRRQPLETPISVEQTAMGRSIDHGTIVVLAVALDHPGAELLQHLHADRLVVDEGAR